MSELWLYLSTGASAHLALKPCENSTLPESCMLSASYLHESLGLFELQIFSQSITDLYFSGTPQSLICVYMQPESWKEMTNAKFINSTSPRS